MRCTLPSFIQLNTITLQSGVNPAMDKPKQMNV
jgi:hypothetical protein